MQLKRSTVRTSLQLSLLKYCFYTMLNYSVTFFLETTTPAQATTATAPNAAIGATSPVLGDVFVAAFVVAVLFAAAAFVVLSAAFVAPSSFFAPPAGVPAVVPSSFFVSPAAAPFVNLTFVKFTFSPVI